MECREYRKRLQDWLDGDVAADEAAALRTHAEGCPDCAAIADDQASLERALRELPAPEAPHDLTDRLLARARSRPRAPRAGIAAAAVVVLSLALVPWLQQQQAGRQPAPVAQRTVNVPLDQARTVQLSLASARDLEGVTLTLSLPEHVELAGRAGEHSLSWRTDLRAGDNRLRLPLRARRAGSGDLIARIEHDGSAREMRVRLATDHADRSRLHDHPRVLVADGPV